MEKPFDENYIIHSDGQIWSNISKKFLKLQTTKNGYLKIKMYNKNVLVHRIVAQTYLPNPNNLPQINHINEDKTDNRVENLEWCDNSHNQIHKYKSKNPGIRITSWGNFEVRKTINGKQFHLGTFKTLGEASEAYYSFLKSHNL